MARLPKVLVYDSGVGALSIAKEILREVPACKLVCAADNAFFPYGTKDDEELSNRVVEQLGRFHELSSPDIVVLACNTASTLALETLRARFDTPFVGVVPAIKPAASSTTSGVIGVLATSATIRRPYTKQLINEFASDRHVILQAADALVSLAESKIRGCAVDSQLISALALELLEKSDNKIDTLVLACTHFPLLKQELSVCFEDHPLRVQILDSGAAIARRVKFLLQDSFALENGLGDRGEIDTMFSDTKAEPGLAKDYRTYLLSAISDL